MNEKRTSLYKKCSIATEMSEYTIMTVDSTVSIKKSSEISNSRLYVWVLTSSVYFVTVKIVGPEVTWLDQIQLLENLNFQRLPSSYST